MYRKCRAAKTLLATVLASGMAAFGGSLATASVASAATPRANSHWTWCNDNVNTTAPSVVWARIQQSAGYSKVPAAFWSNTTYRDDIAKIICYESTYEWHAENGPQYGWFQMNQPLIASEGVTWGAYWSGTSEHHAGWYQCTAGELYILHRYSTPTVAWEHEEDYGWY